MTGEPTITVVGNLTADLEPRQANNSAVVSFTVAATPRKYNRQTNQWEDGETLFQRCQVWREQAENFVRSAGKGTRVVVTGVLKSRSYTTQANQNGPGGETKTIVELEVEEIGLSLRYAAGRLTQANPTGTHQQQQYQPQQQAYGAPPGTYQHSGNMQEQGQWGPPQGQQQPQRQQAPQQGGQWGQGGWGQQQGQQEPPF